MDKRQVLGRIGEEFACNYLISQGHKIIRRNYSSRFGEIDIITLRNKELFFVEVKTRATTTFGYPSEAVGYRKMRSMDIAIRDYLGKTKYHYDNWSVKVIEVLVNEIDELEWGKI